MAQHLKLVNSGAQRLNYYNQQKLCSNKFFFNGKDPYFFYSLLMLLCNFASFAYLLMAYIFICWKMTSVGSCLSFMNDSGSESGARIRENQRLQRKTLLIIVTDFLRWMPIAIVSFWFASQTNDISNPDSCKFFVENKGALAVFASVAVPINSAINPVLYSSSLIDVGKAVACWNYPSQDNAKKIVKPLPGAKAVASVSASVHRDEATFRPTFPRLLFFEVSLTAIKTSCVICVVNKFLGTFIRLT